MQTISLQTGTASCQHGYMMSGPNIQNQLTTDFNEFNLSLVFLCPTFILHKLASLNKLNACSTEMEMCCVQTNCLLTRTDWLFPVLINLATFIFSTGRISSCSFLFIVPITPKHIIVPQSNFFPHESISVKLFMRELKLLPCTDRLRELGIDGSGLPSTVFLLPTAGEILPNVLDFWTPLCGVWSDETCGVTGLSFFFTWYPISPQW